jgi:hypothetical protein
MLRSKKVALQHGNGIAVSAGAKIPIEPIEFSPPLAVVNRNLLHLEEGPRLVKGERHARTQRTAAARDEHPGDQRADRLGYAKQAGVGYIPAAIQELEISMRYRQGITFAQSLETGDNGLRKVSPRRSGEVDI